MINLTARLRRHMGNPRFRALSEQLDALKDRYEQGQMYSIEFLKALIELARNLLQAERNTPPQENEDRGKAALTELCQEARTDQTSIVVERVGADIDEIVRYVRFNGWQSTSAGEREVKRALRRALLKYQLHQATRRADTDNNENQNAAPRGHPAEAADYADSIRVSFHPCIQPYLHIRPHVLSAPQTMKTGAQMNADFICVNPSRLCLCVFISSYFQNSVRTILGREQK